MYPLLLIDSPDDGYCEERGWVSTEVDEADARFLLKEFCADPNTCDPPYVPQGPARIVYLAPTIKSEYEDEHRWTEVGFDDPEAEEFWEIDVTE